ncbi:VWA domain-containing protein [Culicoidibacter larvae]|nr:VWA domain-containing protein [Culicoidibacter larvae]
MKFWNKVFIILLSVVTISVSFSMTASALSIGAFEYADGTDGTYLVDNDANKYGENVLNYNYDNPSNPLLDEEGFVNYNDISYVKKYATQSDTVPGLFDVNLEVKGNSQGTPIDLVFIIDFSSTMVGQKLENTIAGMNTFIDEISTSLEAGTIRVGIVTYNRQVMSLPYTSSKADLLNFLANAETHTGTFIQKGLNEALQMYQTYGDPAHRNLAIHIGDGSANRAYLPVSGATLYPNTGEITPYNGYSAAGYYTDFQTGSSQYYTNSQSVVDGDPTNAILTTSEEISNLTLGMVVHLKQIGVEFYNVAASPSSRGEYISKNIASNLAHYFTVDENLEGLSETLTIAANTINTIQDGKVIDPMGEHVILEKENGVFSNYTLSGFVKENGVWVANNSLTNGVTVREQDNVIYLEGLHIGYNEKVTLTYKIHLNTENNFKPDVWYLANQRTILVPTSTSTDEFDFPIPAIRGEATTLNITKAWSDFEDQYNLRPNTISYYVTRNNTTDPNAWTRTTEMTLAQADNWQQQINTVTPQSSATPEALPLYNNKGEIFDYSIVEVGNNDYLATVNNTDNNIVITNTLKTLDMTITKVNQNNQAISGIEFELTGKDVEYNSIQQTNAQGQITFNGLIKGNYVLHERTQSAQYKPIADINITLDYNDVGDLIVTAPENWDFKIVNEETGTLAVTGGEIQFMLVSIILMTAAASMLAISHRSRFDNLL